MNAREKLEKKWREGKLLCVGLDTDPKKLPDCILKQFPDQFEAMFHFNQDIVKETKDEAAAYKLNCAFYESLGGRGMEVMKKTVNYIKEEAPEAFVKSTIE